MTVISSRPQFVNKISANRRRDLTSASPWWRHDKSTFVNQMTVISSRPQFANKVSANRRRDLTRTERHRDDVTTSQRLWITGRCWEQSTVPQRISLTNCQWCSDLRFSLMLSWTNWCCCFETYWSPYDVTKVLCGLVITRSNIAHYIYPTQQK